MCNCSLHASKAEVDVGFGDFCRQRTLIATDGGVEITPLSCVRWISSKLASLTAETVQGTSLSFQSVYHIEGSYCLAAGVLSVCHCISDDVFQEYLHDDSNVTTYYTIRSAGLKLAACQASTGKAELNHRLVTRFGNKLP